MTNATISPDTARVSAYYDGDYFDWQKECGELAGWAASFKFKESISKDDTVIDFGCGGGFLLNKLECIRKIGIDPNPSAAESAVNFGIQHFCTPVVALEQLGEVVADVIISNNALEHTLNPLQDLRELRRLLKMGGLIHFIVPCDSITYRYNPKDINYHLYSWSPQNLGNLFTEAGFEVEYSCPYIHKYPPHSRKIARLGWPIFNAACRLTGQIRRSWYQVEIRARKPSR